MKKKLVDGIKIVAFLAVLSVCIFGAMMLVRRNDSNYKYKPFFEEAKKDNIDVLFMGSSHVINGLDPVTLYKDYGYTSYNMGGHGSVMQATYWELIETLDYCTPEWIVVDAYMLEKNYQYLDVMEENASEGDKNVSIEQLHLNMDAWPLNKLKVDAVKDLIKDPAIQKEFLFDFMVYHSRWNELSKDDYMSVMGKENVTNRLGSEMRKEVEMSLRVFPDPEEGQELSEYTLGAEYLMRIIEECQQRDIGVVVTYLPFCATTEDKMAANTAGTIASMYGVPYLNMLNMGIIDIETDLNDPGHLNIAGATKVTDFVGEWLSEHGDLVDHRGDAAYSYFDECVEKAMRENLDYILEPDNLYCELEMLSLGDYSCVVYLNQESGAFADEKVKRLVAGIAESDKIYQVGGPYICIKDAAGAARGSEIAANGAAGNAAIYEAGDGEVLDGVPTGLGNLVYMPVEQLFRFLYPKEDDSINYLYDDEHIYDDIRVIVYDSESGEILARKYYKSYGSQYKED